MEAITKFLKLGYGYGYGSGDGSGSGSGSGDGSGYGSGDGLLAYNGLKIHNIDGVNTCITNVKGNVAKGFIVNNDLTIKDCFIVKNDTYFAHGDTIQDAKNALQNKIFAFLDTESKIREFKNKFSDADKKYPAKDFYDWHHLLTGSCEMGRNSFVSDKGIDLSKDTFTVSEFISFTSKSYGSDIIAKLIG